jgi:RNA polymerase sigma-70 factor (ECF subfamily)
LTEPSDSELIRQFRSGENPDHAFTQIIQKYQERLYWHIRKIVISHEDTDDLLQNTFMKAFQSLKKFREDASLYTWLYRIATNESLSFIRRRKRISLQAEGENPSYLENTLSADPYFSGDEIQEKFQKAILRLPDKQRMVFNMRYYDELKYEEMSEILETSVGALKASYHHAIKKLELYLSTD